MNIFTGLSGEYNIVITRPDGTKSESGWFKNLILNSGLNRLGSTSTLIEYARVGTGTSTPTVLQTSLDAQVASTTSSINGATSRVNSGSPNYSTLFTYTFTFAQGAVVGNISEVGVGWATTGSTLFSRSLIVDSGGTPVTLAISAIDQLTVFYRLSVVPSLADTTGSVTLGSTAYNYTCRPSLIASFVGGTDSYQSSNGASTVGYALINTYPAGSTIGPITGAPSGSALNQVPSISNGTYTSGTFYRDTTWAWGPSLANHSGGLQAIQFIWGSNSRYYYQVVFNAPIPKTNTTTLTLQTRFTWGRA